MSSPSLPPASWPQASPCHPLHGLDQRSSLRKMSFPSSARETLLRLLRHCAAFPGARKQPSPREIEVVLDAINEFIFNCGGALSSSSGRSSSSSSAAAASGGAVTIKSLMSSPPFVELQMIQILYEFFNYSSEPAAPSPPSSGVSPMDRSVLLTAFVFVFMEPTRQQQQQQQQQQQSPSLSLSDSLPGDRRLLVMGKLVAAAVAGRGKGTLDCAGVWMHQEGAMSERPLKLARFLSEEHFLLARDRRRKKQQAQVRRRHSRHLSREEEEAEGEAPREEEEEEKEEEGGAAEEDKGGRMVALFGDLPATSEVFCANLVTATCEVYLAGAQEHRQPDADGSRPEKLCPPPTGLVRLFVHWLTSHPLLTVHCLLHRPRVHPLPPGGQNLSHQSSLLGLARWSVLSALLPEEEGAGGGKSERKSAFAALHLALIESLAEIKLQRSSIKLEILQMKHLVLFIQNLGRAMRREQERREAVEEGEDDDNEEMVRRKRAKLSTVEHFQTESLERLGQFLLGLSSSSATASASGKSAAEVIGALQQLPGGGCRVVQMYVIHLAGGGGGGGGGGQG